MDSFGLLHESFACNCANILIRYAYVYTKVTAEVWEYDDVTTSNSDETRNINDQTS